MSYFAISLGHLSAVRWRRHDSRWEREKENGDVRYGNRQADETLVHHRQAERERESDERVGLLVLERDFGRYFQGSTSLFS